MLKKTITYTDYNGVERTEDFYFNLTKTEIMEMEMGTTGGFSELLVRVVAAKDTPTLIKIWKEFILKAYGERSLDGRQFVKSEAISTAFSQTEAYSQLFMEMATNADAAAKFINGVVPADMAKQMPAIAAQ